jgi:metallo-beta-lactamase class B
MAEDYARTFRVLKSLKCDIFLGAHGNYYGMEEKYARLAAGAKENPFVDPKGYIAYVEEREHNYVTMLAEQKQKQ